jgi:hypothetical protein
MTKPSDSETLKSSVENFLDTTNDFKNLLRKTIDLIPETLILQDLRLIDWEKSSTIIVAGNRGMNLRQLRGISNKKEKCYQKNSTLVGFYEGLWVHCCFFQKGKELVLLFFCEAEYINVFEKLITESGIKISDIKKVKNEGKIRSRELHDESYGYPLGR